MDLLRSLIGSTAQFFTCVCLLVFPLALVAVAGADPTSGGHSAPSSSATWQFFPPADIHGPMGHAPIGVMADHAHKKGDFMLSLRYMGMEMDGLADGTNSLSASQVTDPNSYDYIVAPTSMTTQMLMLGAMWAPLDQVTLMVMLPYVFKEMDHVIGQGMLSGQSFTARTNGVGDLSATALVPLIRTDEQQLQLNIGWGFPTGSIDETDNNPLADRVLMGEVRLPYPMQLGSGSFEFRPGLLYRRMVLEYIGLGLQGSAKIRMDDNSNGYRLGDEYEVTAWSAVDVLQFLSASFRLAWQQRFNIEGQDPAIMTRSMMPGMMGKKTVPTAFPGNQAFRRLYGFWGVNLSAPHQSGFLKGHRLAFEVGFPFWQSLDGPQLKDRLMGTVAWQYSF